MPFWNKSKKDNAKSFPNARPPTNSSPTLQQLKREAEQCLRNGDHDQAHRKYSEILSHDSSDVDALLSRSLANMNLGPSHVDDAIRDADAAIDVQPHSTSAWSQKAHSLFAAQRFGEAEQAAQHALRIAGPAERLGLSQMLAHIQSQKRLTATSPSPIPSNVGSPTVSPIMATRQSTSSAAIGSDTTAANATVITANLNQSATAGASLNPPSVTSNRHSPSPTLISPPAQSPTSSPSQTTPAQQSQGWSFDALQDSNTHNDDHSNPPPSYTASVESATNSVQQSLRNKEKGMIQLAAKTLASGIDSVQVVHVGHSAAESVLYDMNLNLLPHTCLSAHSVNAASLPGNTYLDVDPETDIRTDGMFPGTLSVFGANETYRAAQLAKKPRILLSFEAASVPPVMQLDILVPRLTRLRLNATLEDNVGLRDVLGQNHVPDFISKARAWHIEMICMCLNKGFSTQPERFMDVEKAGSLAPYYLAADDEKLRDFLFLILLGMELVIRLRKEPITRNYNGFVTDRISALMVLATLWAGGNHTYMDPAAGTVAGGTPRPRWVVSALTQADRSEALIQFAEHMQWPYIQETRHYMQGAYLKLINAATEINNYVRDWLFGMHRPGQIFRHLLMTVLATSSLSVRAVGPSKHYRDGLVLADYTSYWPSQSPLGRVLGALPGIKYACSIVGPVKVPITGVSLPAWVLTHATAVTVPVPAVSTQDILSALGFGLTNTVAELRQPTTSAELAQWNAPEDLRRPSTGSHAKLASITLLEPQRTTVAGKCSYKARLHFDIYTGPNTSSTRVSYTLYSCPTFVAAPKCVGAAHPIHDSVASNYMNNILTIPQLANASAPREKLTLIDARGEGEELVARSWCAERGRNAIIRRGGRCCFACATKLASAREGLAYMVLIWAR